MSTITNWVVSSKLHPPPTGVEHVCRTRLESLFSEVKNRSLTIVSAPAGYGKTTLLTQWHQRFNDLGLPVLWLSLDQSDKEVEQLIRSFLYALEKSELLDGDDVTVFYDHEITDQTELFINVAALLESIPERITLFLDEYQYAQSQQSNSFINYLLAKVPQHLNVVIATRELPRLDISSLQARELYFQLEATDLSFSLEETDLYFSGTLSTEDVAMIYARTEGWPVAVQLAKLTINHSEFYEKISTFSGQSSELAKYLTDQILSKLPVETLQTLMDAAILERVNGDLLNCISQRDDSWQILEEIERKNLLIVPLDSQRQWYRFHYLLKTYLSEQLKRRYPNKVSLLHRRATQWFYENGYLQEAVRHATLSEDEHYAASLAESSGGWQLGLKGNIFALRALSNLPENVIQQYPRTQLGHFYLMMFDGRHAHQVRAAFDEYAQNRDSYIKASDKSNNDEVLDIEFAIVDCLIKIYEDKAIEPAVIERFEHWLVVNQFHDSVLGVALNGLLSNAYFTQSDYSKCKKMATQTIAACKQERMHSTEIYMHFYSGLCHFFCDSSDQAAQIIRTALNYSLRHFGRSASQTNMANIFLASIEYEQNNLTTAQGLIKSALSMAEQKDVWFESLASGYKISVKIALYDNRVDDAFAVIQRGLDVARFRRFDRLEILLKLYRIQILCITDQVSTALDELESIQAFIKKSDIVVDHDYRIAIMLGIIDMQLTLLQNEFKCVLTGATEFIGLADNHRDSQNKVIGLTYRALAYWKLGDESNSVSNLLEAIGIAFNAGYVRCLIDPNQSGNVETILEYCLNLPNSLPEQQRSYTEQLLALCKQRTSDQDEAPALLSRRENQVLNYLARGYTNKEIANNLTLSEGTIKGYRKTLYKKLAVNTRASLISVANTKGLI